LLAKSASDHRAIVAAGIKHLQKVDPLLKVLIREIGPCSWEPRVGGTPYESLVRAVAHQQLHGKAAETILARFCALVPKKRFPAAADVLSLTTASLRAVGFSGAKVAAIQDIALHTESGLVPSSRAIARMSDDAIVEQLTEVRGVGRWTVEMLLMFQLGRPDVLPVDDFGVRNGFRVVYGLTEMPKPKSLLAHGEIWRPFRSVASWYFWRAADRAKKAS
jgi:DNA-3-methyladenine glycosylase II